MSAALLDDDDRLGIPVAGIKPPMPEPRVSEPAPTPEPEEPVLRAGETDLGRPPQIPARAAPLTDDERRRLNDAEEAQALRELAEAEEMLASDPAVIRWAGWFAHPLAAAILVGAAGALGLFLYSQVLNILATLATQPTWAQYAGYAGLALLSGAVLYSMLRLTLLYACLQRNRQLRVEGLEELHARTRLRWLALAKSADAKARLEDYLRKFPIQTEKERKKLARVGVTPAMATELMAIRDELLDPARFGSSGQWFTRFRDGFQGRLDAAADERVKYWAKRTGVVTALAPNGLVDSAATVYFGFAMIADLCQVYNLRAGNAGTAVLLGRVFFNAYLAGQLNDLESLTEEHLQQLFHPGGPFYEFAAARMVAKVGAKATSGMLNYFLLNRLGKYTCRLLRPVAHG
ncbi:DUF697 domain-containing protein [Fimbriiglobus ruber]|uniref:DUF697 domain-containing protein n=1 Tax=Fimbriiglobus ruber TaxID=1908690 RepID=A0A225D4Z0_9BACT|nr:DUF697 domain-containing protein [Fimbriiglobus ruber]OWK36013.1 hypothetical protein FRUB_08576 [Fimbriiglobus ruber]